MRKIGVLTGGADCPGLNSVIRAVVRKGMQEGYVVTGIKNGWLGLIENDMRILDLRPVRFFCPCSRERAASSVALLGSREISSMIEEEKQTTVTCQFCRAAYEFDAEDLEMIRAQSEKRISQSS